jgi:hypothetical protein
MMEFKSIASLAMGVFLMILPCVAVPAHGQYFPTPIQTMTNCVYVGALEIGGAPAENGLDEVGVFTDDGEGGEILIGAGVMGAVQPGYYYVTVYGDDPTTPDKDGAVAGDTLIFKVWDSSTSEVRAVNPSRMNYVAYTGLTQPVIPPTWHDAHTYGMLNLTTVRGGDVDGNGNIELKDALIALKLVIAMDDPDPCELGADLDGDGRIGLQEAVFVLWTVSEAN